MVHVKHYLPFLFLMGTSFALPDSYKSCGLDRVCVPQHFCIETGGTDVIDINIKNADCGYLEKCCDKSSYSENTVKPQVPPVQHVGCGYRNLDGVGFRITGGVDHEAQFGEFPWMVAILHQEPTPWGTIILYECGGALIAPSVVVTAAHCVQNRIASSFLVRAGEWDTQTKNEVLPHVDRQVSEIILHEQFNDSALFNDIALLIVDTPFEPQENVRHVCLPPTNTNFDLSRCFATGWGKDKFEKEGKYQVILKKIELPVMPRNQCQSNLRTTLLGEFFHLDESFICAGGEEVGIDTCKGDGGSPLVCPIPGHNERYYQAGIVAWGMGCGEKNIPGVYANVAHLRPWIDEKLSKRGIDFSYFLHQNKSLGNQFDTVDSEEEENSLNPIADPNPVTEQTKFQPTTPEIKDLHSPADAYKSCGLDRVCVPQHLCKGTDGKGVIDISIKNADCGYLEKCCDKSSYSENPVKPPVPSEQHVGCGYRNPDGVGFRITGGVDHETQFGEFPWMVAILRLSPKAGVTIILYECGGALIAPTVVVTAAHCVQNRIANISSLLVRAGEWDIQTNNEVLPHVDRRVREIILHEQFNNSALFNDIALLIVDTQFDVQENVRHICLPPPSTNFDLFRCFATGWGKDNFENEGKYQMILKKIELPVMPRNQCQSNLRTTRLDKYFHLDESFICAGGEQVGIDTCKGDGGSPLVCPIPENNGRYYQAGIVTWGMRCGEKNIPGVYANIAYLRPWIDEKLSERGVDFSYFTA